MKTPMKPLAACVALTLLGFAPAMASACEYEAAAAAAAAAARIAEEPVLAATKVPAASTVKAPAIKPAKQEATRQAAKLNGEPSAQAKVAVAQRN